LSKNNSRIIRSSLITLTRDRRLCFLPASGYSSHNGEVKVDRRNTNMPEITSLMLSVALGLGCIGCGSYRSPSKADVSTGYQINGEVRKPGYIPCDDNVQRTLVDLISERGGLTEAAYHKKVYVIHHGTTNYYDIRPIQQGLEKDPPIPCGSVINIHKRIPF
jgi:hypothetical protein